MPKIVKIILACALCLAVAGALIWLLDRLGQ